MWNIILCILLLVILFFIWVMLYDGNRFYKVTYTVTSEKLLEDQKILLLSDLHNKCYGKDNERLLQAIEDEKPDGIYVAGDMITSSKSATTENGLHLMTELAKKYPIYYGMGNHEHKLSLFPEKFGPKYESYEKKIREAGIHLLKNESVYLPQSNIRVCGLQIDRDYFSKTQKRTMSEEYVEQMLGKSQKDAFQILIAHNPDYFPSYAAWSPDLVLSGHVHGGIMRLPILGGVISPTLKLFPHFDGGEFREGDSTMILSRGLGMHTLPIRIFNPGELVIIALQKK